MSAQKKPSEKKVDKPESKEIPIQKVNKDPMSIFQQLRGVDETVKTYKKENPFPSSEEKKENLQPSAGTGESKVMKENDYLASFSSDDE